MASACYGLCLGCWFLLVPVLLTDLFGTERISSSYGLVRMFQSIGAITVPPLAGDYARRRVAITARCEILTRSSFSSRLHERRDRRVFAVLLRHGFVHDAERYSHAGRDEHHEGDGSQQLTPAEISKLNTLYLYTRIRVIAV